MKVVIFKGRGVQPWRFRLLGFNGEVVSMSEGYVSKWNVKRVVKKAFPDFPVEVRD